MENHHETAGARKAKALIELANHSVGSQSATHYYKLHLKQLPIKGISVISLAGILGEAGDLSGFAHGNALLRHAGLNLAEASSGKWTGQMKISKRGRSRTSKGGVENACSKWKDMGRP
jgi:transposase